MKALAIVALVFSALSIFIPVGGVFIALLCSVLALIAFRSEHTLAGITFGINIINTAFLSPSIMLSDAISSNQSIDSAATAATHPGEVYWAYVGFHLLVFVAAMLWRLMRGKPKQHAVAAS